MTDGPLDAKRPEFLIAMYNQLMGDINRHIVVIWQSVGVLFGSVAALSLVEKKIVTWDAAASLILILCIWVVAHVVDAGYWYNRNLVIIANIERQFLKSTDLRDIHYYFGAHRKSGRMIAHLRIQRNLAIGVAVLVLLLHASEQILPSLQICRWPDWKAFVPDVIAIAGLVIWYRMVEHAKARYDEFVHTSPGIQIDTTGIEYGGPGHPTK